MRSSGKANGKPYRPWSSARRSCWWCSDGLGEKPDLFPRHKFLRDQGAGCTLLISPLLSLMRNQIAAARNIGVRAETINSIQRGGLGADRRGTAPQRVRRAVDFPGAAGQRPVC